MDTTSMGLRGILVILLMSVAGCDSSGSQEATGSKEPNPTDALYVCNQADATISIIDPDSNSVVKTVDLSEKGFSESAKPHHVVVEPDGSAWYVSLIGNDAVVKLNQKNEVVGQVSFEVPGMLSLHPSADRLYAGHTMSIPDVPSTVAIIRRSDMALVDALSVFIDRPHGMKVSPTGAFAFTSSLSSNQIVAIDTETDRGKPPAFISGSHQRYVQMAISFDGQTAYLTGQDAGQVHVLDLQNPASPTLTDSVEVGAEPWHPQLSDDGETLYFGSKATNTVYAMDTKTFETTTIEGYGLAQPHGSALSPDGRTLYISNNNQNGTYTPSSEEEDVGTVVAIDTKDHRIRTIIEVGENPTGINSRWQP